MDNEQLFIKIKGARTTIEKIQDKFEIRNSDIVPTIDGNIIIYLNDYGEIKIGR